MDITWREEQLSSSFTSQGESQTSGSAHIRADTDTNKKVKLKQHITNNAYHEACHQIYECFII